MSIPSLIFKTTNLEVINLPRPGQEPWVQIDFKRMNAFIQIPASDAVQLAVGLASFYGRPKDREAAPPSTGKLEGF